MARFPTHKISLELSKVRAESTNGLGDNAQIGMPDGTVGSLFVCQEKTFKFDCRRNYLAVELSWIPSNHLPYHA
ncbi:hypothetical protein RRG08_049468 [Elysia crispata]|uniref:Uncharacterized protein n=1 Tax=Elysia crispata TaxID=231223 RepID=A0AAE0ZSG3_9GAST|nr:hypothetical protein RRG08_049468 [Elysia crispata]